MMDYIVDVALVIFEKFSELTLLVVLLAWYFISRKIKKSNKRFSKLNKSIKRVNNRFIPIESCLIKVADHLDIEHNMSLKFGFVAQNSPLTITEKGLKVAKDIKAQKAIDENWDKILKQIRRKGLTKDNNAYDIQKASFKIGDWYMRFIGDDGKEAIKTYAVKNGYSLYDFDSIFGILIRDKYFKENGIDITS